jgi:hypothetical protein
MGKDHKGKAARGWEQGKRSHPCPGLHPVGWLNARYSRQNRRKIRPNVFSPYRQPLVHTPNGLIFEHQFNNRRKFDALARESLSPGKENVRRAPNN